MLTSSPKSTLLKRMKNTKKYTPEKHCYSSYFRFLSRSSVVSVITVTAALLMLTVLTLNSCAPTYQSADEIDSPAIESESKTESGALEKPNNSLQPLSFDPLAGPGERDDIPALFADSLSLLDSMGFVGGDDPEGGAGDESSLAMGLTRDSAQAYDTYRIQLFNSRVFTDAALEQTIAQEIFDYHASLDYEVPYFKVRLGDFADFKVAERYLREYVKPAGYPSSWVARVRVQPVKSSTFDEALAAFFDSLRVEMVLQDSLLESQLIDSSSVVEEEALDDDQ